MTRDAAPHWSYGRSQRAVAAAAAVDRYLMGSTALPAPVMPADRPLAV